MLPNSREIWQARGNLSGIRSEYHFARERGVMIGGVCILTAPHVSQPGEIVETWGSLYLSFGRPTAGLISLAYKTTEIPGFGEQKDRDLLVYQVTDSQTRYSEKAKPISAFIFHHGGQRHHCKDFDRCADNRYRPSRWSTRMLPCVPW